MPCDFFPHTILAHKRVGAEDSLGAVFTAYQCVIGIRVGRDRGVLIVNTNLEVSDLFAVHFSVGGVLHIRQHRFLCGPRSTTETASPIVGVTLFEERCVSSQISFYRVVLKLMAATALSAAGFFAELIALRATNTAPEAKSISIIRFMWSFHVVA
jgi:hypothetical protein